MAYTKTNAVTANVTTATADQYNSLMAEVKAAVEGISTHDVDLTFTYTGGSGNDLMDTVTVTDNSPVDAAGFDITGVGTWTYDGSDYITQFQYIFSAGEMNITITETYTYDGSNNITAIGRTLT